tara:strand:- start:59 stop:631 length:573 start_codon:yes stop_codon:yes gene_type:complete
MKKNTEIKFEKNKITVLFNNLIKNQIVTLDFLPLNKYQLTCDNISISNKSKSLHLNSTDLRKINIHNLVKTSVKLIDKNISLDQKKYDKLESIYNPSLKIKDLTKLINNKLYSNRDELLSIYSLLYLQMQRDFGENITKKLSDKTKYKESYIKNLTKECFSKAYMKNSNKGLAGGILTNKALRVLSHLQF